MGDKTRGLYRKFSVTRTDGRSVPGEKHADCEYLVLDLSHDPFGRAAAVWYAEYCRQGGYRMLADDILRQVEICKQIAIVRGDDGPEAEFSSRRSLKALKKAAWRVCNAHLQGPDLATDWGARLDQAMETLREFLRTAEFKK